MSNSASLLPQEHRSQYQHWLAACYRLEDLGAIAPASVWSQLERETGVLLRSVLRGSIASLIATARERKHHVRRGDTKREYAEAQWLRREYLRLEMVVDFFTDAMLTRADPTQGEILRGLDRVAHECASRSLGPLGHTVPPTITYLDKGLGASVLKANLRLWDRKSYSPAAVVKVTRHNLLRPLSVIHEVGHSVAHITGWNPAVRRRLAAGLPPGGKLWSSWSSEVTADAYAVVLGGYAAVSALRNVVENSAASVFHFIPGDPHPIPVLRTLLGYAIVERFYGTEGPWKAARRNWEARYPIASIDGEFGEMLEGARRSVDQVVDEVLFQPYAELGSRSLVDIIDPSDVSPAALGQLQVHYGDELYHSRHVAIAQMIPTIALTGLRMTAEPSRISFLMKRQQSALRLIGGPTSKPHTHFSKTSPKEMQYG